MCNVSMLKNMSYKTMNGLQCFDIQHTKYDGDSKMKEEHFSPPLGFELGLELKASVLTMSYTDQLQWSIFV